MAAPDVRIIVRPEQDFYLFNQEQPVHFRVSAKDETVQHAEILRSVRLNCTVYDPKGQQVTFKTKPNDTTTVYSYVSFALRKKSYKSGVYRYQCRAISENLKLEKVLTIIDYLTVNPLAEGEMFIPLSDRKKVTLIIKNRGKQIHYTNEVHNYVCVLLCYLTMHYLTVNPLAEGEMFIPLSDRKKVTLIIKNRGKQIHYTNEVHNYVCVLEGPPIDALRFQRNEPRWISRENSKSAVALENVLYVTEEASIGYYHYRCFYNKNGLKLHSELRFSVLDKNLMTLDIDPIGHSTFVYHTQGIRPAFRCHTKYLGTNTLHRPIWRLLHGQSDFVIKDETDYTQSQSTVYLVDDKEGQSTFQCSLR
ncbi:hypothetical protein T265_13489, partial [Opisthorchis viverrini]